MTTTIERTRPKLRTKDPISTPSIREICLVGDPARRYIHLEPEKLRTEDSGLNGAGKLVTG